MKHAVFYSLAVIVLAARSIAAQPTVREVPAPRRTAESREAARERHAQSEEQENLEFQARMIERLENAVSAGEVTIELGVFPECHEITAREKVCYWHTFRPHSAFILDLMCVIRSFLGMPSALEPERDCILRERGGVIVPWGRYSISESP
jgi:hypothetical protein